MKWILIASCLLFSSCLKKEIDKKFKMEGAEYIIKKVNYLSEIKEENSDWVHTPGYDKSFVEVQYQKINGGNHSFLPPYRELPVLLDKNGKRHKQKFSRTIFDPKDMITDHVVLASDITYSMIFEGVWNKDKPYKLLIDGQYIEL